MAQQLPPGWSPQAPTRRTRKRDAFADFRARHWWELVLIFLPITLVPIGGVLGGATGGAALWLNLWIAKKSFSTATKVVVMVAVVAASYVIFFKLAALWYTFVHTPNASTV